MDAKSFLKQFQRIERTIEFNIEKKQSLEASAMSTTSFIGGERVQSSGSQQKMADAVAKYIDIESEIAECVEKRKDIINVMEQLDLPEYVVVYMRYVKGMTFDEIAYDEKQSKSWATTTHGRALENVQRILDEREKG